MTVSSTGAGFWHVLHSSASNQTPSGAPLVQPARIALRARFEHHAFRQAARAYARADMPLLHLDTWRSTK